MSKPLVDVIIPTYNCADFVGKAVNSVLAQDYPNIRTTVIDDASTDNTNLVLCKFRDRINIVHHCQNMGEQAAVNTGLRHVSGDYFIILNADDLLLPGAVVKLVDFMESHPDILCGYPDWQSIDEAGNVRRQVTVQEYDFKFLISHHNWQMSVGSIFRSALIQKIGYRDESFRWLGDADYWLRIGLMGDMARVPFTLACWRHRNGQASGQKCDERAREFIRLTEKWATVYRSGEARCWANLVAASVTDSGKLSYMWRAFKAYPRIALSVEFWDSLAKRATHILRR